MTTETNQLIFFNAAVGVEDDSHNSTCVRHVSWSLAIKIKERLIGDDLLSCLIRSVEDVG